MQRIVFDGERMKYHNTGLFHFCLNLGQFLQHAIDENNQEITYFLPQNSTSFFDSNENIIIQNSLNKFMMPPLHGYDIWHCTYQNSRYLPIRNQKIKVVLTIHDLNFLYENRPIHKVKKYTKKLQRNINRADAIVCISEFTKKDVEQYCDIGNKLTKVIYNGANPLKTPLLGKNSYKPSRPFLFTIGVISRKKNFHSLIPLLAYHPDKELVLAGRTDRQDYIDLLIQTAKDYNVLDRVHIVQDITEEDKSWYLHNCLAFAMPSIAEGFGLPVIEAMSCGVPIFLSNITALPEIGGDAAYYFPNFDPESMNEVFTAGLEDYIQNNRSESIKQRSKLFDWKLAAQQYVDIYNQLK